MVPEAALGSEAESEAAFWIFNTCEKRERWRLQQAGFFQLQLKRDLSHSVPF